MLNQMEFLPTGVQCDWLSRRRSCQPPGSKRRSVGRCVLTTQVRAGRTLSPFLTLFCNWPNLWLVTDREKATLAACGPAGRAGWLVTGRLLVRSPAPPSWVPRCPWVRHLTLTAADKLAVALRGWLRRQLMLGNIVKRFEWPIVEKRYMNAIHLQVDDSSTFQKSLEIVPTW